MGQIDYQEGIDHYVADYNAVVAYENWAKVEYAPVQLTVNDQYQLHVKIDNERGLELVLERKEASDMDGVFPRVIDSAIIVMTHTTVIIIDPAERLHFALSIDEDPRLPNVGGDPLLVYPGFGLGRHWSRL